MLTEGTMTQSSHNTSIPMLTKKKIIGEGGMEAERERKGGENIDLLFYFFKHSLVDSFKCLDQGTEVITLVYPDDSLAS